ncbi:MAG: carboxymuconolactone decarboxylase family protein [Proteobacteria bacterium]|nr:carboxymuconolactone decarboxylase family protein [Pseudomonadota bacterium]
MPRIRYIEEDEKSDEAKQLIAQSEERGAPDPRVVSIMVRNSKTGVAWVKYWNTLLYDGILPHTMKELCRIQMSMETRCGYCSTVRSKVAQKEGLTEEKVAQLHNYKTSNVFTDRERAAIHYATMFKTGDDGVDSEEVYDDLRKLFSEEEIIELGLFCAETDGAGKLVRSFKVLSWGEACEINPKLRDMDMADA